MELQNGETSLTPKWNPFSRRAILRSVGVGAITIILAWIVVGPTDVAVQAQTTEEPTPTPTAVALSPCPGNPYCGKIIQVGGCRMCNPDFPFNDEIVVPIYEDVITRATVAGG